MTLILKFHNGIEKSVEKAVRSFADRIQGIVDVKHRLVIHVVFAPAINVNTTPPQIGVEYLLDTVFGLFHVQRKTKSPCIYISGDVRPWMECEGITKQEAIDVLLHFLCHELAHYEQWRDGKSLQERGVEVRAKNLFRKGKLCIHK